MKKTRESVSEGIGMLRRDAAKDREKDGDKDGDKSDRVRDAVGGKVPDAVKSVETPEQVAAIADGQQPQIASQKPR
jgi:hypothetical protein